MVADATVWATVTIESADTGCCECVYVCVCVAMGKVSKREGDKEIWRLMKAFVRFLGRSVIVLRHTHSCKFVEKRISRDERVTGDGDDGDGVKGASEFVVSLSHIGLR